MNFIEKGKASVIIDGQWGSTGKGLIAAWLALQDGNQVEIATTNASANAGHTTCFADGRKFVTFHLPTFGVIQGCNVYLNAGSIIDPELLMNEIDELGINRFSLFIHPHAAVITAEDKAHEKKADSSNTRISSTQKGVGTALARKIRRESMLAKDHPFLRDHCRFLNLTGITSVVEVPQGFDLSLNHGMMYPYVTSRDITISSALNDAGLHPSTLGKSVMSCRTYPIRVGNIRDEHGKEIGYSGDCYPDQREHSWEELGQNPELTTVTKRVRRIFNWSPLQYQKALGALKPDFTFINFVNYLRGEEHFNHFMYAVNEAEIASKHITKKIFGIGPNVEDVYTNVQAMLHRQWRKK